MSHLTLKEIRKHEGLYYARIACAEIPFTVRHSFYLPTPAWNGDAWAYFEDLCGIHVQHVDREWAVVCARDVPEGCPRGISFDTTASLDYVLASTSWDRQLLRTGPLVGPSELAPNLYPALCWVLIWDLIRAKHGQIDHITIMRSPPPADDARRKTLADQVLLNRYMSHQQEYATATPLSAAERETASALWSAQLRAKVQASEAERKRKEREQVTISIDPEDL